MTGFDDAGAVSDWALQAVQWAVAAGMLGGSREGSRLLIDPQGSATRAQVATILMRYIEKLG